MRRKVVAGNWKMNNDLSQSVNLISEIKNAITGKELNAEVIICPPFTSLETANALVKDTNVKLGAQNMNFEDSGAFTGEISASMLKSVGCEYVILGHSERRIIFDESDEVVNKKINKALSAGLKPIFCIGETLEQRENGTTKNVIDGQVRKGLSRISAEELASIIIAYEPVWAIGTGRTATPDQAQEMHKFIRDQIKSKYGEKVAEDCSILYGGSCKASNAPELFSNTDVDGGLIGGASLNSDEFLGIVNAF